jgi:hypothetical protein
LFAAIATSLDPSSPPRAKRHLYRESRRLGHLRVVALGAWGELLVAVKADKVLGEEGETALLH